MYKFEVVTKNILDDKKYDNELKVHTVVDREPEREQSQSVRSATISISAK